MPFVTEELWQRLPRREGDDTTSIMVAEFPKPVDLWDDEEAEKAMTFVIDVIHQARSMKSSYNLAPSVKPDLYISTKIESQRVRILLSSERSEINICHLIGRNCLGLGC